MLAWLWASDEVVALKPGMAGPRQAPAKPLVDHVMRIFRDDESFDKSTEWRAVNISRLQANSVAKSLEKLAVTESVL